MVKEIISGLLGVMATIDGGLDNLYVSQPVAFPALSDTPVRVVYLLDRYTGNTGEQEVAHYDTALRTLMSSEAATRQALAPSIHSYAMKPEAQTDYDIENWAALTALLRDKPAADVWNHIHLNGFRLFRMDESTVAVELRFGTQWTETMTAFVAVFENGNNLVHCGANLTPRELRDKFGKDPQLREEPPFQPSTWSTSDDEEDERAIITLPMFGNIQIPLTVVGLPDGSLPPESARQAWDNLMAIDTTTRNRYSETLYAVAWEYMDLIGLDEGTEEQYQEGLRWKESEVDTFEYAYQKMRELWRLTDKNRVWEYVQPRDISMRRDEGTWYIQIYCNSWWDTEHGINLTFRNGKELLLDYDEIY